jgi:hypothetical protein
MTDVFPFPFGRFTEGDWLAAYQLCLDEADAVREAAWHAAVTAEEAETISISEADLVYLSLVSTELAGRVAAFRREVLSRPFVPMDDRGISEAREREWETLRSELRRGIDKRGA